MSKFTQILCSAGVLILLSLQMHAQRDYRIRLQSGVIDVSEMSTPSSVAPAALAENRLNDRYYVILQFEDIPDAGQKKRLEAQDIKLLGYLPNYAYWASIPAPVDLAGLPVRALVPPRPRHKLSGRLVKGPLARQSPDQKTELQVLPFPDMDAGVLGKLLSTAGLPVEKSTRDYLQMRLNRAQLMTIAAHPAVMFVDVAPAPLQAEDLPARSLHGFHALSAAPGIGLDGSGSVISVADDGIVAHPDLKSRITHHLDRDDPDHHSDMVLGILGGAGNIDPAIPGMAPGAEIHLFDINDYQHIREAPANFATFGATITSTSYGEGCGGFYGASAQEIDAQVHQYPFLFHCFSAGNEAAGSCSSIYGHLRDENGYAFGNITGGQKAAKNVITVGNLYYNGQLMNLSSRGPAEDGRIKPDLCANGQGQKSTYPENAYRLAGGSSAAAPVVAGAAAVLSQLYRQMNPGATPPSGLLKAALLNTAEDLGAPGPDFKHGWGSVQLRRAAEVLSQRQYLQAQIDHGQEVSHPIDVPADAFDLRIMLYWHDPAGNPAAGQALVNDLDLVVQSAGEPTLRPWVLSTAPEPDSINRPAYPGVDRVNNVEQVIIPYPKGGSHLVRVQGHIVPDGPQEYYIVYSYRTRALQLTYPTGGEYFAPGEKQTLRWEAFGITEPLTLECRINGGEWKTIAADLSARTQHFNWYVPAQVYGQTEIRIRSGQYQDRTSAPFSILAQPEFSFVYESERSAWIQWSPVEGAEIYDIYQLGDRYMEKIGSTDTTRFLLSTLADGPQWYSVRARRLDGTASRRAIAKRYLHLPCETTVKLQFQFDAYPGEIRWQIRDQNDRIVAGGGPYDEREPNSRLEITECLPYGCYELIVLDSYGDGLCCQGGRGSYQLLGAEDQLLANGDSFGYEDRSSFCLDNPSRQEPREALTLEIVEITPVACHNETNGGALVQARGGLENFAYFWNNGQRGPALTNAGAGVYRVTVSDGQSTLSRSIRIDEPPPLNLAFDVIPANCADATPGQITALPTGGTAPYQYAWSSGQTTARIDKLPAGPYTLTLTDGNGCQSTATATLEAVSNLQIELTVHQPRCPGDANGRIITGVQGGLPPYSYRWSNGATTVSLSQLPPGSFALTVTDAAGCPATAQTVLLPPDPIEIDAVISPMTDDAPGAIELVVRGGMPGYDYQWADGSTMPVRSELTPGEYSVTVSDYKGCAQSAVFTVPDETTDTSSAYCDAAGQDAGQEWIEAVAINNTWFMSGNNEGYKNYTAHPVQVASGRAFTLELRLGKQGGAPLHYWRVWIDFNRNGQWDDPGELVFQSDSPEESYRTQISVPGGLSGPARMRVAMQWGAFPHACGQLPWGEVEDYTLTFVSPTFLPESGAETAKIPMDGYESARFRVFPNPADAFFQLDFSGIPTGNGRLFLVNAQGQQVGVWPWTGDHANGIRSFNLPTRLSAGLYYLRLQIGGWRHAAILMIGEKAGS